jgi:biopolymer transport protein ExbB
MKRLLSILTLLSFFMITSLNAKSSILQDEVQEVTETVVDSSEAEVVPVMETVESTPVEEEVESANFHQELKKRFIEGGPGFMGIVLLCLILGLAIAIERIIYLNLATSNSDK